MRLLAFFALLAGVSARFRDGTIPRGVDQNFETIANFCYDFRVNPPGTENPPPTGSFSLSVWSSNGQLADPPAGMSLVIYDDEEAGGEGWPAVYDTSRGRFLPDMTCAQRVAISRQAPYPITQWYSADTPYRNTLRQGIRPRFWYFVLSCCDCAPDAMAGIQWEVRLLNDETEWAERRWEFGFDEYGIEDMYLWYFFIYLVYMGVHYYSIQQLSAMNNGNIHRFILYFTVCIGLEFLSIIFNMGHWWGYGRNGVGSPGSRGFAFFLNIVSRVLFVTLLLLLGQGFQVTDKHIPFEQKKSLMGLMGAIVFFYIISIFWEYLGREPEHVNPPLGERWLIALLNLTWFAFAAWFGKLCYTSYTSSVVAEAKKAFYYKLGFFTVWIAALPIVNFVYFSVASWHYVRGTTTMNLTLTTLGYMYFSYITWPKHAAAHLDHADAQVYVNLPGGDSLRQSLTGGAQGEYVGPQDQSDYL